MPSIPRPPCLKLNRDSPPLNPNNPLPFASSRDLRGFVSSHRVHFPPTPALESTHAAYSAAVYDRAPIDVRPNECEIPERGRRVYVGTTIQGSRTHPPLASAVPPPLIPDVTSSSESDDTDAPLGYPPRPVSQHIPSIVTSSHEGTIPYNARSGRIDMSLSFLPHPHTPSECYSSSPSSPEREKNRPKKRRNPSARRTPSGSDRHSAIFNPPSVDDDGCLGGF
jgi:hypothetical protein